MLGKAFNIFIFSCLFSVGLYEYGQNERTEFVLLFYLLLGLGLLERYKIPPIPNIYYFLPQVLTDLTKKKWTLGRSIGTGGFGEIYLAVEGEGARVGDDARYRQRFI